MFKQLITATLAALLLTGCTTATIEILGADGTPVANIKPQLYGRGCITADYTLDADTHTVAIIIASDATTDWSLARLFGFLGDIVGGTPFGGSQSRGSDGMGAPASDQGCAQLFESGGD